MYQHGKKTKRKSNPRVFLHAVFVLGIALVVVAFILRKDIATENSEKTTVPILTEVKEDKGDVITIDEPQFKFELPSDWVKANRVQSNGANYYEWKSTKKGADDRMLRLHVDTMPASYKVVRMQPITPNGDKLRLGNLSGNCIDFSKDAGSGQRAQGNAPSEAKWEGVTFMCDPINNNQTIGTGTIESGIATKLVGNSGVPRTFFFYFEDHNIRPDDKILTSILQSFVSK